VGLNETKKLLHNKRNGHQIQEAAHRLGEIFVSYTSNKGLITIIYMELKTLNYQKINEPMKKWSNEQRFFKERSPNAKK
jgi:hypothetical protein